MSLYAILRHLSRWPCEPFSGANHLRNFQHKQISPCELRLTWLPCGPSIRCFSHTTVSVFAFLFVRRTWTFSSFLNRKMIYHWSITTYCDVLTQLLHTLLEYKIQHTTYLSSRGVISRLLRSVFVLLHPLTTQTALLPLVATPRTITLPFLIPIGKLVLLWSRHHPLLSTHPGSLAGQSMHVLPTALASRLHPPVLSVNAGSPQWAGLHSWTIAGAGV